MHIKNKNIKEIRVVAVTVIEIRVIWISKETETTLSYKKKNYYYLCERDTKTYEEGNSLKLKEEYKKCI